MKRGPALGQRLNEGVEGRERTEHVEGATDSTKATRGRLGALVGGLDARLMAAHKHDQGSGTGGWGRRSGHRRERHDRGPGPGATARTSPAAMACVRVADSYERSRPAPDHGH